IFFFAGQLDQTMSGPEIDHNQGLITPRRSIYFRHASEKQMEFLKIFDTAAVTECYQRKESIVPHQALALANSELTSKQSRNLARTLSAKWNQSEPEAFVRAAFETVLSRYPSSEELAECVRFLEQQTQKYRASQTEPPAANDLDITRPA